MFRSNCQYLLEKPLSPYRTNVSPFLKECELLKNQLSQDTLNMLEDLVLGKKHCIQLECGFLDEVTAATPSSLSDIDSKAGYASELIMGSLAAAIGGIFGYKEQNGFIIHDIFPVKGMELSNTGANSVSALCFHSDGATHPVVTPDFVILFCLKPDSRVRNYVAGLRDLLAVLPGSVIDELKKPVFRHRIDEELEVDDKEAFSIRPIITTENGRLIIKFDVDLVTGINDSGRDAIEQLNSGISKLSVEVANTANSVLMLDNKACLHARSAFTPSFDGTDRWVQSAFVSKDRHYTGKVVETPRTCALA